MSFAPVPGQEISIGGSSYAFVKHAASIHVHQVDGREATVYRLVRLNEPEVERAFALKVFKTGNRKPEAVLLAKRLGELSDLTWLTARNRHILTPELDSDEELLRRHTDLTYAALMPWIDGPTWAAHRYTHTQSGTALTAKNSLHLALSLVKRLSELEQRSISHCDLSSSNMIIGPSTRKDLGGCPELVDLEQIFTPKLDKPYPLTIGSYGYARNDRRCVEWSKVGDRYAGAVLLAEILGACHPVIVAAAPDDISYFRRGEVGVECPRHRLLAIAIRGIWGPHVLDVFNQTWQSPDAELCATFGEWRATLPKSAPEVALPALSPEAIQAAKEIADQEGGAIRDRLLPLIEQYSPQRRPPARSEVSPRLEAVEAEPNLELSVPEPAVARPSDPRKQHQSGLLALLGVLAIGCTMVGMLVWTRGGTGSRTIEPTVEVSSSTERSTDAESSTASGTEACALIEEGHGQIVGEASGGAQRWNARLEAHQKTTVTLRQTDDICADANQLGFVVLPRTREGVESERETDCVWSASFDSGDGGLTPISIFYYDAGHAADFELTVLCAMSLSGP